MKLHATLTLLALVSCVAAVPPTANAQLSLVIELPSYETSIANLGWVVRHHRRLR